MPSRRDVLAGAGAAALGATAGCLDATEPRYAGNDAPTTDWWPQATFDRYGTCYTPRQVGPRESVDERWSLEITTPSARPVVADGTAFLPAADAVIAADARTGEVRWREPGDDGPFWPREVAYHDGTLYVAALDRTGVYALDAASGERLWTFAPSDPGYGVNALLLDAGSGQASLYAGTQGAVFELDPATGERRWRREVFGSVDELVLGIPNLLAATGAGEVYALSRDGDGRWRRNFNGTLSALATATGGGPYVSFFGGPTHALENAGETAWRRDVWAADSFVVTAETVFSAGRAFTAHGGREGRLRWTGRSTTQCGPAGAGDTVYAASEGAIHAYDAGGGIGVAQAQFGATRWTVPVEGRPEQGIAVADGAVFVLTEGSEERSMAYALAES